MSMMQQPSPSSPPSRPWLTNEWDHLARMSLSTMCLLVLPSLLLFALNPLLPIAAYLLQRWAGSSWMWRDRWASVQTFAKQGAWIVAILLLIAWLAAAHILFFPALITPLQMAWTTAHLPGDLSLAPITGHTLVARLLLLLPLAPALSLYYERVDSRTKMHLQRVLTIADLATPRPSPSVAPPASTTTTAHNAASAPDQAPPARPKTASTKQQHKDNTTKIVEQMTIDSVLAPQQEASSASTPAPTAPTKKGTRRKTTGQSGTQDIPTTPVTQETSPTHSGLIYIPDWDDVAE